MEIESMELRCACCGEVFKEPVQLWIGETNLLITVPAPGAEQPPMILSIKFKAQPVAVAKRPYRRSKVNGAALTEDADNTELSNEDEKLSPQPAQLAL